MDQVWEYYNTLPQISSADERFQNRETTFAALTNLLSKYNNAFGVCLVHAHCKLSQGEIMLADENVSQPVPISDAHHTTYYADRWLPSGKPYEFTTQPTQAPPDLLFQEFQALTRDIGVLGLYYPGPRDEDQHSDDIIQIEWTEGRKNFVRGITQDDWEKGAVETAWVLGKSNPATIACVLYCKSATSGSGKDHSGDEGCYKPNGLDCYHPQPPRRMATPVRTT